MSNLGQRQIVIGLIPETKQRAICIVRRQHHRAYHETFFTVRQILEGKVHASLVIGKLDDQASRVPADRRILDVLEVGHHLPEVFFDFGVCRWGVSEEPENQAPKLVTSGFGLASLAWSLPG